MMAHSVLRPWQVGNPYSSIRFLREYRATFLKSYRKKKMKRITRLLSFVTPGFELLLGVRAIGHDQR